MAVKKHRVKGKGKEGETIYRVFWDGRAAVVQEMDSEFKWANRFTIQPDKNYHWGTQYIVKEWAANRWGYQRRSDNTYRQLQQVYSRLKTEIGIEMPGEITEHLDAYETMQFMARQK